MSRVIACSLLIFNVSSALAEEVLIVDAPTVEDEFSATKKIKKEDLDRVPYTRPGDIFNNTPGVTASNSSNATGLQINIRGLQANERVKTMIDGATQSSTTYRGYPGNRDNTYIDPDLIGGVDINKGPTVGPSGAAIGGAVNLRTLNGDDLIKPGHNYGVSIKQMYGNNVAKGDIDNDYQHMARDDASLGGIIPTKNQSTTIAAAFRPTDYSEFTFAHTNRASGNYKSGKQGVDHWADGGELAKRAGQEVFNTSLKSESYLMKARFNINDKQKLTLSYLDYDGTYGYYSQTNSFFMGPWTQGKLQRTQAKNYTLNYAYTSDNPLVNLNFNLWKTDVNGGEDYETKSSNNQKTGSELWNTSNIPVFDGFFAWKYGVSFSEEKARVGDPIAADTTLLWFATPGNRDERSAFTQLDWNPDPMIKVSAGVQRTRTTQSSKADKLKISEYGTVYDYRPVMGDRKDYTTNRNAGLFITPLDGLVFFGKLSAGERAPSLREAYMTGIVAPNPDLKTEKSNSLEFGVNYTHLGLLAEDDKIKVGATRFVNKYKDYVMRQFRTEFNLPESDLANYSFGNIPKAQLQGYELSIDYDSKYVFINAGMNYYDKTMYCYNIHDYNSSHTTYGQNLAGCHVAQSENDYGSYVPPRVSTDATIGLKLFESRFIIGGRMRSASRSLFVDSNSGIPWDNYRVYDLFSSYKVNEYLNLGLSVENISNQYYIPAMSSLVDGLSAPGRTARLTVTASF